MKSTESKIAEVHAASAEDVDKAVQAAKAALVHDSWKQLPGTDRGILMAKLADLIEENKELLATIDAWDNGKHKTPMYILNVREINTLSQESPTLLH
ncbi:mitochondrial aldehyde dehydrogenase [Paraconiothyrium brasiliense]|uniref:Mitochondrial aldehyde dehydrogenase n=1 Tax=Paraconiothyrium brasiliense TaxID=300254 RepID=A0ABR3RSE9_9PLEO